MDTEFQELRRSMRPETEAYFGYILREDRPILELIDSDYAFVNAPLAKLYGIPGVDGRRDPQGDPARGEPPRGPAHPGRGPDDHLEPGPDLGGQAGQLHPREHPGHARRPPPPPDIPRSEEALKGIKDREPTMREVMEVHRADALCAACHNRMDPLGLAFENLQRPGDLARSARRSSRSTPRASWSTGRTFKDARELKQILKTEYKLDVYRCLTEKMMTYALGRGPEYQDVETVDQIVDRVEREGGKFSAS